MLFSEIDVGQFDRPRIIQPKQQEQQTQQRLKIVFETDPLNKSLITNPQTIWKLFRADKFLSLKIQDQLNTLEFLIELLQKSDNNCHILTDTTSASLTSLKLNQAVINTLQQGSLPDMKEPQGCPQDILFQLILIGLNCDHPQVNQVIKTLGNQFPQYERCHVELVYQHVRIASDITLSRALSLLNSLFQERVKSQTYFYFNGFLSGILLHQRQKQIQPWPFNKGFAACLWFNISAMSEGKIQDPSNLPVLFNCYSQGYGGFECYFNQNKLLYRILPPIAYQPPTIESNGFLVSEFVPGRWNFLAIEHDKPYLARAQLIAVVNDKQVVSFSMDYPKFDKSSKLNQVCICNNFIGKMSNFLLFKEQVNNPQKFIQIFKQHQPDFKQFDLNVFEQRLQEKLFLMYTPTRAFQKTSYDSINMNDGELLINCGVWGCAQSQRRPLLQEQGGLFGLLALLGKCTTADQVNAFFKILLAVIASEPTEATEIFGNLFQQMFSILQKLPYKAVNCQTIKLLTELRFAVQDKFQNEIFFKNLMMSADFWISTENFEVMQEYWSFAKAIYSQNPVRHNQIFPIQNLISLMVNISETQQQYCCEYHMRTNEIFYGNNEINLNDQVKIQIDKYLEPIAGLLECVLTSGGDEILVQIDHITRSLTQKSCPCYHIQILKLLKVLLLDSKSNIECASPIEVAKRFLNAHGLQILLYLCANNAALDVKALCLKLIDVLSSHSSLIQMRIDTDLITYLSHVLLPVNIVSKNSLQKIPLAVQQDGSNEASDKYYLMGENSSPSKGLGLKFFSYQEAVNEDTQEKENFSEHIEEQSDSFELLNDSKKEALSKTQNNFKTRPIINKFQEGSGSDDFKEQEFSDKEQEDFGYIPPLAPKTSKNKPGLGFKFGGLALDDSGSGENQSSNEEEPEFELKQPNTKPKGFALKIQDDDDINLPPSRAEFKNRFGDNILDGLESDEGEYSKANDEEAPKPTVDVLMSRNLKSGAGKGFNFLAMESSDDDQEQEEVKEVKKPSPPAIKFGKFSKPGLKLSLSEEPEEVQMQLPQIKKPFQPKNLSLSLSNEPEKRLAATTGATNDVDFEEQLILPPPRKPGFKLGLKLDTDKINDQFTFGGEKGEMKEEQANEQLEDDIKELALKCVTTMRKNKADRLKQRQEDKEEQDFNQILKRPDKNTNMLNTNQKIKGIKKIELEQLKTNLADVLEEEVVQSLYTPSTAGLNGFNQFQLPHFSENQKSPTNQSDEYTGELENLYTSCLEWILNRAPSGLFKTMMVDDYDKITFLPAMQVLMVLVSNSNNLVRQRALQDMFMLAQWDSQNGQMLLQHKEFHYWLLELLTPYQQERQSESSKAVYDMGSKLHTLLLKNSCTCPDEEDSFKKLNLLVRWPIIVQEKGFDPNMAHQLTRSLIISLTNSLAVFPPALKNLTHLTLQVHELILSSTENKPIRQDLKHSNESLFSWVSRQYLKFAFNESEDVNQWIDLQMTQAMVQSWDQFFLGQKQKIEQDSLENNIRSQLFAKNQDEIQLIVEILMQVDQNGVSQSQLVQADNFKQVKLKEAKPSRSSNIMETINNTQQSVQKKLLSLGGFNQKGENLIKQQQTPQVFLLQSLVNMVCLQLTVIQGEKSHLKHWLSRLELYFKYTIMVTELWRKKVIDEYYNKIQKRMAEICAFMLAFLFQEIHSSHTPKSQNNNTYSPSNSENIQKSKMFQQCLKSCLIFMINMAGIQQDQPGTRCIQVILQQILVKQYSNQSKPLISSQDITRLIESNFDEFPECFQQNDWKIAFFHNSIINVSIEAQLNQEMIDQFISKRQLYAIRFKEAEASTAQANDEILKKIQAETLQAISTVKSLENDCQNESLLLIQLQIRKSENDLQEMVKLITGSRALWSSKPKKSFLKLQKQLLGEGQRCLLKDCQSNTFKLYADTNIQATILKEIHEPNQFLTQSNPERFKFFSRKLNQKNEFSNIQLIVENLFQQLQPQRKQEIEFEQVSILNALDKRQGSLIITNYEIVFVYDITAGETNSTIFFFQWQPLKKLTKQISLTDIKEIQKRRFLGQNKALELFLMDNKTLLFDFKDHEQRDQFIKKIQKQRTHRCKNLNYYNQIDHKHILNKSKLTEDWVNCKISNFKYLMAINQLASRSYHDLSQYPVFPWVLTLTKIASMPDLMATSMRGGAPPNHFRDLTKNMQLLGSAERQAEFKRKYEDIEGFDGMNDRFHCGSHYSNPGIILHYLVRLQPFYEANVVLQAGAMDSPDRIFQSVSQSYQHSINDFSDVRELIPEFYTMPEMFINQNLINFGQKEDQSKVDDVILPDWCQKNAQKFVQQMREALESTYVSQNLNSWIDYIFGYKQRDYDAVNCLNTFSKITYQVDQPGDFDITSVQDASMRAAMENQGYNFGQTPLQLFKEKHPMKLLPFKCLKGNIVVDELSKLKIFKPVPVQQTGQKLINDSQSLISTEAILYAKFVDQQRIIGAKKEGFAQNFVWLPRAHDQNPQIQFSLGSDRKQKFNGRDWDKGMDQVDRSAKKFDYPMLITNDGNYIVKAGFWDGRIIFCPIEGTPSTHFELRDHKTTVCVIACDSAEKTMITGCKSGEVIVWRNSNFDTTLEAPSQANHWVNFKQLNDHERQISSIFINEEMCLFLTSSTDSYINMYNLWTAKIIRSFSHPNQLPIYSAVLAQSPIPLVAFFSRDDHMWYAYSLNGSQIQDPQSDKKTKYEESFHVVQPIVVKSTNYLDKLVYGTERGYICMRNLPSLERYRKLQVSKDYPVLTLLVSPDRRFLLTGCGDGGLIVIAERGDQQQAIQSQGSTETGQKSTRNNTGQNSLMNTQNLNQSSILSQISSLVSGGQSKQNQ